jgi:hypothetical protein
VAVQVKIDEEDIVVVCGQLPGEESRKVSISGSHKQSILLQI